VNVDARCERSSADKDIMSVGLGHGVCVGSPVNQRTFMAVGRKQIEGMLMLKPLGV